MAQLVKESTCNVGDRGPIPGLGRSPGEGKGYPLQYSGLENSMDCIVHGVAKSQTQLSNFHFTLTRRRESPLSWIFFFPYRVLSCSVMSNSFMTLWTVACHAPLSKGFFRQEYWKVKVKVTQSCLTLCDPMDYIYSPWNSPGQNTGVLEWVAFPFSRASSQPRDRTHVSCFSCIGRHILFTIAPPVDPLYYSQ